jgi:putative MATE family efflux protein
MRNKNVDALGSDSTFKALIRLSLPAIASLLINATYNIVDSLFVGREVGTVGLSAVGFNFPLFIFLISIGVLVGVGGSALISRSFGQNKREAALSAFGNSMFLLILFGILCIAMFIPFSRFWMVVLGAESNELAREYFSIVALGSLFVLLNQALNSFAYAEGNGRIGFLSLAFSSLVNIGLDWLFIFIFKWGVAGAAWATLIAQASGSILLLLYFALPGSQLSLRINIQLKVIMEILRIGVSAALRTFSVVFLGLILNRQAFATEGDLGTAVASVIFRVISLIVLPAFGINQAFLPIAAYNFGAGSYKKLVKLSYQAVGLALAVCYIFSILVSVFAVPLARAFNPDAVFVATASQGFRIAFILTPFLIFNLVGSGIFQAVGDARRSLLISVSRIAFFMIPLLLLLPRIYGIQGIWISFPLGELLSSSFAAAVALPKILKFKAIPDTVLSNV